MMPDHGPGLLGLVVTGVNRKVRRARMSDGRELPIVEAYDSTGRRLNPRAGLLGARTGVAEHKTEHGLGIGFAFDFWKFAEPANA